MSIDCSAQSLCLAIDPPNRVPYTFHPPERRLSTGNGAMDMTSPEMAEIAAALAVHQADKPRGRPLLLELWDRLSPTGTPLQICSLAHVLADGEAEVAHELEWDLRALEAATGSREPGDREALPGIPASFFPSMHLSIAEGYRRMGDLERARRYVACAERRMDALSDDAYGALVRGALRRLQGLLATA
jgi:hypothetical protein